MKLLNKFELVAQLFKTTFCRSFIVYGSNLLCCSGGCSDIAKSNNGSLYDEVESFYAINDSLARYLNPAHMYAFSCVYYLGDFKFYMCTYWQFMIILAANEAYRLNNHFRYPMTWDKLNEYMCTKPCDRGKLYKWCTMIFGDPVGLMGHVGLYVDSLCDVTDEQINTWLMDRWLSLEDLPYDMVRDCKSRLCELDITLKDLSFMHEWYSSYQIEAGSIHDAVAISEEVINLFNEYISQLSES